MSKKGGKISIASTKKMLSESYSKGNKDIGDYKIDHSLSGQRAKVYHNSVTGETTTVHRGTKGIHDVFRDIMLPFSKKNKRFDHAKTIQAQAEKKYGTENMTTLGHSLGATIAQSVGHNSKDVITFNKPVLHHEMFKKTANNQTDIRTDYDPISVLHGLSRKNGKEIRVASTSLNPLANHSTDSLNNANGEQILGSGISRWISHVKATQAKQHAGCSYKQAMSLAKKTYKK
jgi:hypothetical protein